MTPEAQRIAIAEFCGWKFDSFTNHLGTLTTATKPGCGTNNVPDYPYDLNAMHEAEKLLRDDQIKHYAAALWRAMHLSPEAAIGIIHGTASQRAVAFLKTINKWTP